MTYRGEVTTLTNIGDGIEVHLANVKRKRGDHYGPGLRVIIPMGAQRFYPVGRIVKITIKPVK